MAQPIHRAGHQTRKEPRACCESDARLQLIEFAAVNFETAIDTISKVLQDPVEQPDMPRFSGVMGRVLG